MGGSGGGSYFSRSDVESLRAQAVERFEQGRFDAEVNSLLQQALVIVNDRDTERINRDLEQIENSLEGHVDGFDRLLFGGSVAKHTYVDGLSDIDALVILSNKSLAKADPAEVREQFRDSLMRQLPQGNVHEIRVGNIAVTVKYRDGTEIQLLPAIQADDEILISSADGAVWTQIEPRRFAEKLTDTNRRHGGAVVPAIKLAKAIFAAKLQDRTPSGYHVEALAIAAFEDYTGPRTPKAMLTRLVESASQDVLRPIRDTTGQSRHIDEYLGGTGSSERRALSIGLQDLGKQMTGRTIAEWLALLE